MRRVVVDASVFLSYLLPDENPNKVVLNVMRDYEDKKIAFIAPKILKYEIANALRTAVLRRRIAGEDAHKMLKHFLRLEISVADPNLQEALSIAVTNKISIYDALYLALSLSKGLSLVTLDERLKQTAKKRPIGSDI